MRVLLKKGKQRELIYETKYKNAWTWRQFANSLNISISTLRDWRLERCLMPLDVFSKLDNEKNRRL